MNSDKNFENNLIFEDFKNFLEFKLKTINFPCLFKVETIFNKYGKGHFWFPISLGSEEEIKKRNPGSSHLDFWYNPQKSEIYGVALRLNEPLRGKGYGRKLVNLLEDFGKSFSCQRIIININTNFEFWEHFGFITQEEGGKTIWVKNIFKDT